MSFASLAQPAVRPLIERFAAASQMTLVVGAGASMEAGLPSWRELIERLLQRVAGEHPHLDSAMADEWVRRTLANEDLLAAGAIVEAMATDKLDTLLPAELYGAEGPEGFEPGPIAEEIARLRECFGDRLTLLTTNYDDLIERALVKAGALKKNVKTYVQRREAPAGAVAVTHLHGFAGRSSAPKQLVLTEEHYHRMQTGSSWQEKLVTERLSESLCLFIGTTLTDPNLIRYLYGYKKRGRKHAVVFVRQGDMEGAVDEIRAAREEAVAARWRRQGVEAIFVDHFADAAQLLYEIGLQRREGSTYRPVEVRAKQAIMAFESDLLRSGEPRDAFGARQVRLSAWLRAALYDLLSTATGGTAPPSGERLALALWLLGEDGTTIKGWAHSDRAHQDPLTMEAVPIASASEWVAVRAVCQGVRFESDVRNTVSRWKFVRGLPLVFTRPTRLPIGCLTISSTQPGSASVLTTLSGQATADLHRSLLQSIYRVFEPASE